MKISIFKKEEKEPPEPQFYTSATNMPTLNYKVYYMSKVEKLLYSLLAFAVGAGVGYLFYGGMGKNEFGEATTTTYVLNTVISCIVGAIAAKLFIPIRTKQIIDKRRKQLSVQFRDMLDSLNTSLGSGKNVPDSFSTVYGDMKLQYEEGAFILNELEIILSGMQNNIAIEDMLYDFGTRSGIDDIKSFADVFKISYRKGGNMKDIIRNTHAILSDKMEIKEEIETTVSASKMEQKIVLVMPILIIGMVKVVSQEFAANFTTFAGIASTTVAIVLFIAAYFIGKKILDIKI